MASAKKSGRTGTIYYKKQAVDTAYIMLVGGKELLQRGCDSGCHSLDKM
jgi:hypothetical protein